MTPDTQPFKECPNCTKVWQVRAEFLDDPDLALAGYQANFGDLNAGFFLFQHEAPGCHTCLAIEAGAFTDMHEGPIFEERLTGTEACPGYCADKHRLDRCNRKCECAYVRDVLDAVNRWPKKASA